MQYTIFRDHNVTVVHVTTADDKSVHDREHICAGFYLTEDDYKTIAREFGIPVDNVNDFIDIIKNCMVKTEEHYQCEWFPNNAIEGYDIRCRYAVVWAGKLTERALLFITVKDRKMCLYDNAEAQRLVDEDSLRRAQARYQSELYEAELEQQALDDAFWGECHRSVREA
ncbi:hypothetical protein GCM10007377_15800 [Galliscardovia ingluviei]|uniref:Uncharacterized protein n=1 Tax=Galliscardovia ingluviei TaxID=1769422 RepID=A0A8J3AJ67_9BIFI|nr:hypothetical protein [Galliscardovia ingluviei]GGI15418.1 hypothetical protein GCM10007377_15800 [Galliscardovia ingluviei]